MISFKESLTPVLTELESPAEHLDEDHEAGDSVLHVVPIHDEVCF